ncbi:MAG: type II toxin-antitoxin system VapC family toxin [Acidobacteria bacterium]|nr:type II toxin-antitoxin system VapC family toxin [Acidobacteriota bacterium]
MRLLLDTQVALWWLGDSRRLSEASRKLIAASPCVVSVASLWEVAIKHRIGKLPVPPARFRDEMRSAGATILSVSDEHALGTLEHPAHHFDPFDSLLLAVARTEHLILLTADAALLALAQKEPQLPIKSV